MLFYIGERATIKKKVLSNIGIIEFLNCSKNMIIYNKCKFALNVDGIFDHSSQAQIYLCYNSSISQ